MAPVKSWVLVLAAALALPAAAHAQAPASVLVVANGNAPASVEIAKYYQQRRGVPAEQVLTIRTSTADQISRAEYAASIEVPIAAWLAAHQAQDRILYIVLTKGVPLRVAGTGGRTGTVSSVDSELALLYRRMTGVTVPPNGAVDNPYYAGDEPVGNATRFSHATADIYLVTRLDGFTVEDVKALVDRGLAPVRTGRVLLDQRAGIDQLPNEWLAEAARRLEAQGLASRVVLEQSSRLVESKEDVLGYYSWGSNDPAMSARHPGLKFAPGALAAMFVSSDARTFTEPPGAWKPGRWENSSSYHAGSPQSLTGDLIRAGVTGAAGYVAEPYLDSSVRPEILFPAYFAGFNLAEAFYLALPRLSWQSVIVGDPLCAPFAKTALTETDLNPPIDPETELPSAFAARRVAAVSDKIPAGKTEAEQAAAKKKLAAVKLAIRAESRLARDDRPGAREAFEQALALDDTLTGAWRQLALVYEQLEDHEKAIASYRKVLEQNSKDPVSLNNLAYSLAVRQGKLEEALPLAERAFALSRSPVIADTVGWIKYLMDDIDGAIEMLAPAAKALPGNAEVQLHAASAFAAAGRRDDAAAALTAAQNADPSITERTEFQEVRKKIGG